MSVALHLVETGFARLRTTYEQRAPEIDAALVDLRHKVLKTDQSVEEQTRALRDDSRAQLTDLRSRVELLESKASRSKTEISELTDEVDQIGRAHV